MLPGTKTRWVFETSPAGLPTRFVSQLAISGPPRRIKFGRPKTTGGLPKCLARREISAANGVDQLSKTGEAR